MWVSPRAEFRLQIGRYFVSSTGQAILRRDGTWEISRAGFLPGTTYGADVAPELYGSSSSFAESRKELRPKAVREFAV